MHLQCLHLEVVNEQTEQQAVICSWFLFTIIYLPHTHTREMALNIWHWGDPKKNFNWEKNWQSIHFAFLRGVDKYIIIHAHGHQPQEEKLAFKKVAGSSAAKWRLVWFGSDMHHFKAENPSFSENFKVFHDWGFCNMQTFHSVEM